MTNNNNIGADHHQSHHTQQRKPREAEQVLLQTCRHSSSPSINVNKYVYDKNLKGRISEEGGRYISQYLQQMSDSTLQYLLQLHLSIPEEVGDITQCLQHEIFKRGLMNEMNLAIISNDAHHTSQSQLSNK
eukprot:scaffold21901_cov59-Cyclotella_meneghiniana.AAC.8